MAEEEDKEEFHSAVSVVNVDRVPANVIRNPIARPNLIGNVEDMVDESHVPAFEMSHQSLAMGNTEMDDEQSHVSRK